MASLRNRLENSRMLAAILARLVGSYLRFVNWSVRWEIEGLDELRADLAEGPVLLVMWHGRSLMGPVHWPVRDGQLTSLFASSAIGRVSGAMQRQFGLMPMEMRDGASNVANSRAILKRVRDGVSIGMTGDGPLGPALVVQDAPLDWARAMGRPVWGYAFETSGGRHLKTWDSMWVPSPFGTGRVVFKRWDVEVPRKVEGNALEPLREGLKDLLDHISN